VNRPGVIIKKKSQKFVVSISVLIPYLYSINVLEIKIAQKNCTEQIFWIYLSALGINVTAIVLRYYGTCGWGVNAFCVTAISLCVVVELAADTSIKDKLQLLRVVK